VSTFLAPALPAGTPPALLTWLVIGATVAVLAGLAVLRWARGSALHRAVYARALNAGHIAPSLPATRLTGARW
jgi:NAD(P)H-quinone oxidoreductase subunit 5